jgi:hypothetical protein
MSLAYGNMRPLKGVYNSQYFDLLFSWQKKNKKPTTLFIPKKTSTYQLCKNNNCSLPDKKMTTKINYQ